MIIKIFVIDCLSIININRLIDIDCHRLLSISIDCSGPELNQVLQESYPYGINTRNVLIVHICYSTLKVSNKTVRSPLFFCKIVEIRSSALRYGLLS